MQSCGKRCRKTWQQSDFTTCDGPSATALLVLVCTSAGQNVPQRIIPLVAGVFKDRACSTHQGKPSAPRVLKRRGIVNGEFIEHCLRIKTGKAFRQMQVVVGASEAGLVCEIGGGHH